jgi:biotin carboxyl carrier protein
MLEVIGLDRAATNKLTDLRAPMPGLVRGVHVAPGERVEAGTPLLVLEAMKMENVLKAPANTVIAGVSVVSGQTVEKNAVLITFE